MSENRCSFGNNANRDCMVCIDTYRVLDSCRDKDCFEDARVYLTDFGQEIIDRTSTVRAKDACIVWTFIGIEPVQFNRGFYQVVIRFYIKVKCEACVCPGKSQEFDGIAIVEKRVILFGSEGSVSIFRSSNDDNFCPEIGDNCDRSNNMPVAVCEVADPIVLGLKVVDPSCRGYVCCCCDDIPQHVCNTVSGNLVDSRNGNCLFVTLGLFSVIRLERPAQFLINATEYSVPDKECVVAETDDPCKLFKNMAFPVNEFYPPSLCDSVKDKPSGGHCGKR